jgi:hypothetical protein
LFATDFSEASMKAFPYEAALGKKLELQSLPAISSSRLR